MVLCGGGSGGHLTPSLSVASAFLNAEPQGEVLFLISKNPLDEKIVGASGFNYKKISTGKLRRYFSWENFLDFFRFFFGIVQSIFILKKFGATKVFSKGGFVALPVALAAKVLGIPVIAHESDMVQGLANKIIAKFAKKICYSFPQELKDKSLESREVVTGTPIRFEIFEGDSKKGRSFLGFKSDKPIVLFMGASQGALQINELCKLALEKLGDKVNVVLIAGAKKTFNFQPSTFNFIQFEFLGEEFADVLASSDVVVSRAGANSLFEIAALKKASVIVPLDSAAGDHQRANAQVFADKNACLVIDPLDEELEEKALEQIQSWLGNEVERKEIEKNVGAMVEKNAAQKIVKVVLAA